jgi:hypothetical protein
VGSRMREKVSKRKRRRKKESTSVWEEPWSDAAHNSANDPTTPLQRKSKWRVHKLLTPPPH